MGGLIAQKYPHQQEGLHFRGDKDAIIISCAYYHVLTIDAIVALKKCGE